MKLVIKRTLAVLSVQYCNNPSQIAKLSSKYSFQSLDRAILVPSSPTAAKLALQLNPDLDTEHTFILRSRSNSSGLFIKI